MFQDSNEQLPHQDVASSELIKMTLHLKQDHHYISLYIRAMYPSCTVSYGAGTCFIQLKMKQS